MKLWRVWEYIENVRDTFLLRIGDAVSSSFWWGHELDLKWTSFWLECIYYTKQIPVGLSNIKAWFGWIWYDDQKQWHSLIEILIFKLRRMREYHKQNPYNNSMRVIECLDHAIAELFECTHDSTLSQEERADKAAEAFGIIAKRYKYWYHVEEDRPIHMLVEDNAKPIIIETISRASVIYHTRENKAS